MRLAPRLVLLGLAAAAAAGVSAAEPEDAELGLARERMVREQLEARGIRDARVLAAMRRVPRHALVPAAAREDAYDDRPLPIGSGQTISQPFIVAYMTQELRLRGGEKVLEIGTGSGYQAAVLAELAREVFTIEIVPELAERAERDLGALGYRNVRFRTGDGYLGWPEQAPFDAIVITAAPPRIPQPLLDQLAPGGRLLLPVGEYEQQLVRLTRTPGGLERETLLGVRFVPMTGRIQLDEPD